MKFENNFDFFDILVGVEIECPICSTISKLSKETVKEAYRIGNNSCEYEIRCDCGHVIKYTPYQPFLGEFELEEKRLSK